MKYENKYLSYEFKIKFIKDLSKCIRNNDYPDIKAFKLAPNFKKKNFLNIVINDRDKLAKNFYNADNDDIIELAKFIHFKKDLSWPIFLFLEDLIGLIKIKLDYTIKNYKINMLEYIRSENITSGTFFLFLVDLFRSIPKILDRALLFIKREKNPDIAFKTSRRIIISRLNTFVNLNEKLKTTDITLIILSFILNFSSIILAAGAVSIKFKESYDQSYFRKLVENIFMIKVAGDISEI